MPRGRRAAPAANPTDTQPVERASRAEGERTERRRKRGPVALSGQRLTVDENQLDRENFAYRWARDSGDRMARLHSEDWDPAPENAVIGNQGAGTVGTKVGGQEESGKPYDMVLMRKRKDWFEDDQKEKARPLDEIEAQIKRGRIHEETEPELRSGAYTPGANRIE